MHQRRHFCNADVRWFKLAFGLKPKFLRVKARRITIARVRAARSSLRNRINKTEIAGAPL